MNEQRIAAIPKEIISVQNSANKENLKNILTIQIIKILINSKRGRTIPGFTHLFLSPSALYLAKNPFKNCEKGKKISTLNELEKSDQKDFRKISFDSVIEINFSNTEKVKKRNTFAIKVVLTGDELMMIQTSKEHYFLLRNIFQNGLVLSKKNLCLGVGGFGRERLNRLDGFREVLKVFQYFVVDSNYMGDEEFMRVAFGEKEGHLMLWDSRYSIGKRLTTENDNVKKVKGQMVLKFFVPDLWGYGNGLIRGDDEAKDYNHNVGSLALDKVIILLLILIILGVSVFYLIYK